MSLPLANTLEGGSDETTLTFGNSGGASGDAFDLVLLTPGTGTLVFDTARAAHGSLSARVTPDGTNAALVAWQAASTGGGFTEIWGRVYIYLTAAPIGGCRLISANLSAGTRKADISLTSASGGNSLLRVSDATFTSNDAGANVPLNQWVRIEFHIKCSATVGQIEAKMFLGDDASPITNGTVTSPATRDTGASADEVRFGQGTAGATGAFWMDSMQVNTSGFPGPLVLGGGGGGSGSKNSMLLGVG